MEKCKQHNKYQKHIEHKTKSQSLMFKNNKQPIQEHINRTNKNKKQTQNNNNMYMYNKQNNKYKKTLKM